MLAPIFGLSEPDDVVALIAALRDMVDRRDRTRKLAGQARSVAVRYSWRRMTTAYMELYARLSEQD